MSKENINKLIACIRNERNAFSMADVDWECHTLVPADSFEGKYGSPACLLGWMGTLFPNQTFSDKLGLENDSDSYNHLVVPPGWMYKQHYTRTRTIAVLEHLRDTGRVDWDAFDAQGCRTNKEL